MGRPKKPAPPHRSGTRAVLYLRVSQEDGTKKDGTKKQGLDVQLDACEAYVSMKRYQTIATLRDDGVSGATRWQERVGLSEAMRRCAEGTADVIVAYHQDRFARKMGVFEDIRDYALTHAFRLETADGRVLTDSNDFITGDVLSLVSAIERRRIAMRFYGARRHRGKQDGRGSGRMPWGYRVAPDGTLTIDDQAAAGVRLLFRLRQRGETYQQTADALNARGFTTPTGKQWTVGHVQGIERNKELYHTGVRRWDGVTAEQRWPTLIERR
ncbi:MAG: recombinase family protein [Ktedonobacterales bacterium]|nr:recombinase family protein [Ktedonobacterales bacterium]